MRPVHRLRRPLRVLLTAGVLAAGSITAVAFSSPATAGGSAASFTATNSAYDTSGPLCLNGNNGGGGPTNCNIYTDASYVWLNAGPISSALGAGTYFFAVISPGGQANPNDGSPNLLSTDSRADRTFTVDANGVITSAAVDPPHTYDAAHNKIRVAPYEDSPNGVYALAICHLPADPAAPAKASACKYDNFKIQKADTPTPETADPLSVTKDAAGSYTDTYGWGITKSADKTKVSQIGGSAKFTYTVTVTPDSGAISDVAVAGTISVTNPNADGDGNAIAVSGVDVTDKLSDGTVCTVTGGAAAQLTAFNTDFAYSCALGGLPQGQLDNTVAVTWPGQTLPNGADLEQGTATFTFTGIDFTATLVDDCASITDTYAGTLGSPCAGDGTVTYTYSRSVPVPAYDCVSYDNTATFATDTTGATGEASQTVQVCGPAKTGALTIGFWQNKNGQGIITGQAKSGTCPATGWLRQYAPFQDAALPATATCAQLATYVTNVIAAATAKGSSMNAMLKAQMLATALDVYYTGDGKYAGAQKFLPSTAIGDTTIDLTKICTSFSSCTSYLDASSAFGGASSLTISQVLAAAASQSNAGGSSWYGQVKAAQELAKDVFDAVNNQAVFAP